MDAGLGLIVHRGRRSGRTYQTPVTTFPTESGFIIALTYGAENTDWVKNVRAAGGCELRTRGRVLRLDSPHVYHDESRHGIRRRTGRSCSSSAWPTSSSSQ